jgi:hypothetical protein
MVPK